MLANNNFHIEFDAHPLTGTHDQEEFHISQFLIYPGVPTSSSTGDHSNNTKNRDANTRSAGLHVIKWLQIHQSSESWCSIDPVSAHPPSARIEEMRCQRMRPRMDDCIMAIAIIFFMALFLLW